MSITLTPNLNPEQEAQIHSLDSSFPCEEADLFALYEEEERICSAAAFIKEEDFLYECYAYTRPEFRRQGMFLSLLDSAISELPEDTAFLMFTDGTDPDTMETIRSLEAELVEEEYMMERSLKDFSAVEIPASENSERLTMSKCTMDGTETWVFENAYGTVYISVFSSYYYLYGFEIREPFRGRGHGKTFLDQLLADLAFRNPLPIRLQVSGDNLPALSLYKKTGFQITETLFGYLY